MLRTVESKYQRTKVPVAFHLICTSIVFVHMYLQAINRAGLDSALVSKHFIFDRSPPTGGSIVDGDPLLKVSAIIIVLKHT